MPFAALNRTEIEAEEEPDEGPDRTYADLEHRLGISHSTAQRLLLRLGVTPVQIGLTRYITSAEYDFAVRDYLRRHHIDEVADHLARAKRQVAAASAMVQANRRAGR